MQTLWSRVAAAPCSCRCAHCLARVQGAVSRRATIASARGIVRPQPSATFAYTSIFFTATVVDQKIKRDRRKEWERIIEEARSGLEEEEDDIQQVQQRREEVEEDEVLRKRRRERRAVAAGWESMPVGEEKEEIAIENPEAKELAEEEDEDAEDFNIGYVSVAREYAQRQENPFYNRNDDWKDILKYDFDPSRKSNPAQWPAGYSTPPDYKAFPGNSIYQHREQRHRALTRVWTPKKIRRTENAIETFVYRLIHDYRKHLKAEVAKTHHLPETVGSILKMDRRTRLQQIEALQDRGLYLQDVEVAEEDLDRTSLPSYNQDLYGMFLHNLSVLNTGLIELLDLVISGVKSVEHFIIELCDRLLRSPNPPNISTINIICVGFTRLGMRSAMYHLWAVLSRASVRPNEITCSWILRYSTDTNDIDLFTDFVRLMRGQGPGLMLAHPMCDMPHERSSKFSGVVTRTRKIGNPDKIIQKIYPTQIILKELLRGLLKFSGLETTMRIYNELLKDSWPLSWDMLFLLLERAVEDADWARGTQIWASMTRLSLPYYHTRLGRSLVCVIERLCQACGREEQFRELLDMRSNNLSHETMFQEYQESTPRRTALKRYLRLRHGAESRGLEGEEATNAIQASLRGMKKHGMAFAKHTVTRKDPSRAYSADAVVIPPCPADEPEPSPEPMIIPILEPRPADYANFGARFDYKAALKNDSVLQEPLPEPPASEEEQEPPRITYYVKRPSSW